MWPWEVPEFLNNLASIILLSIFAIILIIAGLLILTGKIGVPGRWRWVVSFALFFVSVYLFWTAWGMA